MTNNSIDDRTNMREIITYNIKESIYISSLDPLGADPQLEKLPDMNISKDINNIIYTIQTLVPNLDQIKQYSFHEALAIVRDLGILAGSLKKHRIEPIEAVPWLELVFVNFGEMTDMIPRDTLMHYCLWNPDGERKKKIYSLHR